MKIGVNNYNRSKRNILKSSAEINVIPLIDVILVLLVIFMATAPEMISGIDLDLPQVETRQINSQDEPLVVSIDSKGNYYLHEVKMDANTMQAKLQAILQEKSDSKIFVRGDGNVNYSKVIELFTLLRSSGFNNVALVTQEPASSNTVSSKNSK